MPEPAESNSLVASARILAATRDDAPKLEAWAEAAWGYYETGPELYYGVTWKAKAVSKARLVAARRPTPGSEPEPLESGPAVDAVEELAVGGDGQASMLEAASIHLDVPGAGFLVVNTGIPEIEGSVLSAEEIKLAGRTYEVHVSGDSKGWVPIPEALVVKIWRPSRRHRYLPFSPVRPLLGTLARLQHLNERIDATLVSRLTGGGILLTPSEQVFPALSENVGAEDAFQMTLQAAMTTPIKNRGSAGAVVPLHVQVPGDLIEKWRLITFWDELDTQLLALRESTIKEIATGIDIPAEILLGLGKSTEWSAWAISDDAIKMSIEPTLENISSDLTRGYLRPLRAASPSDSGWFGDEIIWFDISELVNRPDRGPQAEAARDRLDISTPAYLREAGLNDTDAPDTTQLREMAWKQQLSNPALAANAMIALGLATEAELQPIGAGAVPADSPIDGPPPVVPDPSGTPQTMHDPPFTPASEPPGPPTQSGAVAAAAYGVVHRALERAGGRLRNKHKATLKDVVASAECLHVHVSPDYLGDVDVLLAGAWDQVPVIAAGCGVDADELAGRLADYTRYLLATRQELTLKGVADWLATPDTALVLA